MAIGKEVVSAYSGAADHNSFEDASKVSETKTKKITYTVNEEKLYALYAQVSAIRNVSPVQSKALKYIFDTLINEHPSDWLLPLEIYELSIENKCDFSDKVYQYLLKLQENTSFQKLIENGLQLIKIKNN
jgi:phenylalanine-4-hydroxylase